VPKALLHNSNSKPIQKKAGLVQSGKLSGKALYDRLKMSGCLPVVQAAAPNLTPENVDDIDLAASLSNSTAVHLLGKLTERPNISAPIKQQMNKLKDELDKTKAELDEIKKKLPAASSYHDELHSFNDFITNRAHDSDLIALQNMIQDHRQGVAEELGSKYKIGSVKKVESSFAPIVFDPGKRSKRSFLMVGLMLSTSNHYRAPIGTRSNCARM